VYVQRPAYRQVRLVRPLEMPEFSTGIHMNVDGMFTDRVAMGGAGGAFRIRPSPYVAVDIGAGFYGGVDYNGLDRVEVPIRGDVLFFFNPYNRIQFYALLGIGGSFAHAEGFSFSRDYAYIGGELGLGLEWRLSRVFALNFDVRGFIRQRVDDNAAPEFSERFADGTVHSTDTSGGMVGQLGMTFYFGR
ncbi:MAG: porin family protein, partial [Sandaracinaceae bacterium]|nr:porin family protein [Sandaracinaceae bacterium]